ncbi:MAG: Acidobacterial duplicated orphan permease (function unknown) [uncultured Sphingosinicella sp.]|uniref:ABC-type antimicrobial peptide transport system, permease component n=1 Tax=uncultured Sphingosinicella sp. TaxID=478748 RepID=A0A6J4TZP0_9SPHN|nr:ABC transporter permease [uncultured Sphingosinicella sp.]CAA9534785.1 MAG: Acidobacterial duplicated orphan permease (function unknown) [uncultured Sphingosinicella sp.]
MWGNYLTVALRALTKSRTYAFINIFGLAIGLAACLMILLYVRYETSYDSWLPDAERIYQVQAIPTSEDIAERVPQQGAHGVVAESLARAFPEVEAATRAEGQAMNIMQKGEAVSLEMLAAEDNFFRILQLPFIRGDGSRALADMNSTAISRSQAMTLFGSVDVVGRTIDGSVRGEPYSLRVSGVFEDLPRNSHMFFSMVRRITGEEKEQCGWTCINGNVYLKLRPGVDADSINARLPQWERRDIPARNVAGQRVSEGDLFDWRLVNVRDVHLSGAEGAEERPGNDRRTVMTFSIIAILILSMASINFINLATARAGQRAREVALRKVLGARRGQLVTQFLGESMLITGVALLIALALVELSLPYMSSVLNAELNVTYVGEGGIVPIVLLLWLSVGVAGGLYPAFYLSRYQPGEVLKANKSSAEPRGTGRLRGILVVTQFAVSIGLIICTMIVYAQTLFTQQTDLGFRRDGLIQVSGLNRAQVIPAREQLMRRVAALDGVEGVTAGGIWVASGQTLNTDVQIPGRSSLPLIGFYSVEPKFFDTLGIRLLAGRVLSQNFAKDNAYTPYEPEEAVEPAQRAMVERGISIVVNENAARRMGFASPETAVGKTVRVNMFGEELGMAPATIVGVVADSRFRSLREAVEPTIFYDRGIYSRMIVRYRSADPQALRERIQRVWREMFPDVPVDAEFADAQLAELYTSDAARGRTFASFTLLAVVIACLGLFGLAAFTAERRTKEIGIRKVFGAGVRDIVQLLAWQFSKPVIVANLIAWPVAWWVMRDWLNGFDARIALTPGPFLLAGFMALVIAIGTIVGHAVKVARTNPIHALRYE